LKKVLTASAVLLASLWAFTAPASAAGNGCFTLDGQYSRRLSGFSGHDDGLGASWLLEWQPVEFFSIGAGMQARYYFAVNTPGNFTVESVDLVGRYIFNPGNPWTLSLLAGGGLNPKFTRKTALLSWGGDYHLMGGLGAWHFLSPQVALDMGVLYDYCNNAAPVDPLGTLNVRLGLCFFFEKPQKPVSASAPAAPPAAMPQASGAPVTSSGERALGVPITKQEMRDATQASAAAAPAGDQRKPALSGPAVSASNRSTKPALSKQSASNGPKSEPQVSPSAPPTSMMEAYRKAVAAYEVRDYKTAVKYYEQALAIHDPNTRDSYYAEANAMLGVIHQYYDKAPGRLEIARKYYKAALAIDPSNFIAHKHLKALGKRNKEARGLGSR
jgi:hypothetical protein